MKYNLRNQNGLTSNKSCSASYGIDSVYLLAPKRSNQIPTEIKSSKSMYIFKAKITKWIPGFIALADCAKFKYIT